jgi:LytS/YehU family sensor histidine kinase
LKQLLVPFEFNSIDIGQEEDDDYLEPSEIMVPTSLYQPFVENAIEHGLSRRKTNERRLLTIRFREALEDDTVICTIEDTGIGQAAAAAFREKNQSTESFSRQMASKIIKKRAKTLNAINPNTLVYKYEDLEDENGVATGTRVVIKTQFIEEQSKNRKT